MLSFAVTFTSIISAGLSLILFVKGVIEQGEEHTIFNNAYWRMGAIFGAPMDFLLYASNVFAVSSFGEFEAFLELLSDLVAIYNCPFYFEFNFIE